MPTYRIYQNGPFAYCEGTDFTNADSDKYIHITSSVNGYNGYFRIEYVLGFQIDVGGGVMRTVATLHKSPVATGQSASTWVGTGTIVADRVNQANQLVIDGNSWFDTKADTSNGYSAMSMAYNMPGWDVDNFAVQGQSTASMVADVGTQILPVLATGSYVKRILFAFETINQLKADPDGEEAYDLMVSYCEAAKTAHPNVEIIVCTGTERTDGGAGYSEALDVYNALMRADFSTESDTPYMTGRSAGVTYADKLFDMEALNPSVGDGVHTNAPEVVGPALALAALAPVPTPPTPSSIGRGRTRSRNRGR